MRCSQGLLVLMAVMMSNAASAQSLKEGVYVNQKMPGRYIEVLANNECYMSEGESGISGSLSIKSSMLMLKLEDGRSMRYRVIGDTLRSGTGDSYVFWRQGKSGLDYEEYYSAQVKYQQYINEMFEFAASAQMYYRRPKELRGGGQSFAGWSLPRLNTFGATYRQTLAADGQSTTIQAILVSGKNLYLLVTPQGARVVEDKEMAPMSAAGGREELVPRGLRHVLRITATGFSERLIEIKLGETVDIINDAEELFAVRGVYEDDGEEIMRATAFPMKGYKRTLAPKRTGRITLAEELHQGFNPTIIVVKE